MNSPPIPLSVIGGYLGAGKTTLINRILTGDHGRRVAVIVNDFGDIAIDEVLLGPASGGVRALANGCVCCSAVDGLGVALDEIAGLEPRPEHVIIEVSGVGDPWAVAQWGRTPRFELEGIVVVADPSEVGRWVADPYVGDTVRRQLMAADLVVISRDDVSTETDLDAANELIASISSAVVVRGADVALALLLGLEPHGTAPVQAHGEHSARTFIPGAVSPGVLEEWLGRAPVEVVRVKGFVVHEGETFLAQRVGRRVEITRRRDEETPRMTVIAAAPTIPRSVDSWIESLG